jgi:hypothetical protein
VSWRIQSYAPPGPDSSIQGWYSDKPDTANSCQNPKSRMKYKYNQNKISMNKSINTPEDILRLMQFTEAVLGAVIYPIDIILTP